MVNPKPDLFGGDLPVITQASSSWPSDYVDQFWRAYPRRVCKANVIKKLNKIRGTGVEFNAILAGVARYVVYLGQKDATHWRPEPKHPTTWLNGQCWLDEYEPEGANGSSPNSTNGATSGRNGNSPGPGGLSVSPRDNAILTGMRAVADQMARDRDNRERQNGAVSIERPRHPK